MTNTPEARGLPGGIPVPAVLFLASMAGFAVLFRNPELLRIGGNFSPAGICVLAAVVTFFWLLVAIAKRPPPADLPPG